jgi:hypothetical protein
MVDCVEKLENRGGFEDLAMSHLAEFSRGNAL